MKHCMCCGFKLTPEEIFFYTHKCEDCTREDHERIQKWLTGTPDKILDEIYGKPNVSTHPYHA